MKGRKRKRNMEWKAREKIANYKKIYTTKEIRENKENGGAFFALKKNGMIYLLNFDKFTTWHSVFLAAFHQRIHIFDDDKGSLLQGDNTQVVIIWVTVCKGTVPWPDRVLQAQWVVLPFPHLKNPRYTGCSHLLLVFHKWVLILSALGYRYRKWHCKDTCLSFFLLSKLL